jgi:hypothetical protein
MEQPKNPYPTTNQQQPTKNKEQRTKNKEQITLNPRTDGGKQIGF